MTCQTALITGAARRLGAEIARRLHGAGMNVIIHYRSSGAAAAALCDELNNLRPGSAAILQCDLLQTDELARLVRQSGELWGRLDAVVNNAAAFEPTPIGSVTEAQWDALLGSNLKAPFFIAQAAAPWLRASRGSIVNLVDIHAERALKGYPVYSIAKAAVAAMTRALAKELAPEVRVNGVSPGAILWPENEPSEAEKRKVLSRIPFQRIGAPADIAKTVLFLIRDADYITGQVIAVDGGRTLNA